MRRAALALSIAALSVISGRSSADTPSTTLWSIGSPTDEEQYYLELLNRARANPAAEAVRLATITDTALRSQYTGHGVDLEMMKAEISALPAAPPLAMNAILVQTARTQSEYQFSQGKEIHTDGSGRNVFERTVAAGYLPLSPFFPVENSFVSSISTPFGHAAFEVDWGENGTTRRSVGGMQDPRNHRLYAHAGWREVGIGIYEGTKTVGNNTIGPQVVTQDFGLPAGPPVPYMTGVAYYDSNGNSFYDPGEGIGGVTVNVAGALHHAVTAPSGGYAVPFPAGPGERTVTFSSHGFTATDSAVITGTNNVKKDLRAVPPAVSGPAAPAVGIDNIYTVSPVTGASRHDCRVLRSATAAAAMDDAEDLTRVTTDVSHAALSTTVKKQGTGSYHLVQPANRTETITYKATFLGGASPSVRYQSSLRAASVKQNALVQISTDAGATWTTVETQTGSGGSGQTAFSQRTVSLPSVAEKEFLLRFAFTVSGSPANNSTGDEAGWYIDVVRFTDIDDIGDVMPLPPGTNLFSFVPAATGVWLLSARPVISGRTMDFGPATAINAGTVIPPPSFASWAAGFELAAGLPAGTISADPAADYNRDGVANLVAYALGLSPIAPSARLLPQASVVQGNLHLDYQRDTAKSDITLTSEVSTDLSTWFAPEPQPEVPAGFRDTLLSTSGTIESWRASIPVNPAHSVYVRLRVTIKP